MARNYKKEYKDHQSSEQSKKARARRNKSRRKAIASGKVKKGTKNKRNDIKKTPHSVSCEG